MSIAELCTRSVVSATPTTTIVDAAALMRRHHVGNIVVVDRADRAPTPLGLVTDRDIVVEVVAKGVDPSAVTVAEVLTGRVEVIAETASAEEALRRMTEAAVRRLPVVNRAGGLVGIISVNDLLPWLALEIGNVAHLAQRSRGAEARHRK
jgi:CBS domain-containing protein